MTYYFIVFMKHDISLISECKESNITQGLMDSQVMDTSNITFRVLL